MSFQRPISIDSWNCCKFSERFFNIQNKVLIITHLTIFLIQPYGFILAIISIFISNSIHTTFSSISVFGIAEQKIT